MRQSKMKGFTLIELLIVVAIIAILAAIAVPNFLEAQVRSKVSRAQNDMRTLATALESYYVDNNSYPGSAGALKGGSTFTPAASTVNTGLSNVKGAYSRITFMTYRTNAPIQLGFTLTTPVAHITSVPGDPFADTKGCSYGYWNAQDKGWMVWSYGPDTDESDNGQLQSFFSDNPAITYEFRNVANNNTVYNPYFSNPSMTLLTGTSPAPATGCYTYDATNGTVSDGDVWRVKQ